MKQYKKIPVVIAAFEDTGSGRNMECYYLALSSSSSLRPIMAYTNPSSFHTAPSWITEKILISIDGVDHDVEDCRFARCKKPPEKHRTYDIWFSECQMFVAFLKHMLGEPLIWVLDAVKPPIEKSMKKYIVQVFHGDLFDIGVSYFDEKESFSRYSRIFVHGPLMKDILVRRLGFNQKNKIRTIGRVLNDQLYDGSLTRDEAITTYGLDPGKKTLLYAPSWEGRNVWPVKTLDEGKVTLSRFCTFAASKHLNMIIRPHPILLLHFNLMDEFIRLTRKFPHVRVEDTRQYHINGPNVSLIAADFLITDLSSIAVDFLSLQKPVIFFYPKDILSLYGDHQPSFSDVAAISYTAETEQQLYTHINRLLIKKESKKEKVKRRSFVSYACGKTLPQAGEKFRIEMEKLAHEIMNKRTHLSFFPFRLQKQSSDFHTFLATRKIRIMLSPLHTRGVNDTRHP